MVRFTATTAAAAVLAFAVFTMALPFQVTTDNAAVLSTGRGDQPPISRMKMEDAEDVRNWAKGVQEETKKIGNMIDEVKKPAPKKQKPH